MIAILISWIIILFVLYTSGNALLSLYNKFSSCKEEYKYTDTILLGVFFAILFLSAFSFIVPINNIIFLSAIGLSLFYWVVNGKKRKSLLQQLIGWYRSRTYLELSCYLLVIVSLAFLGIWSGIGHDAAAYHYAHIRWYETYEVVPGIANLEDRFGFNSSYIILSALFTFRSIFGFPVYTLHSFIVLACICWVINDLFKSGFEVKRIFLLFLYVLFIFFYIDALFNTSTDVVPNILVLYIFSKTILYLDNPKKHLLFYLLIPVSLITFKLSMAMFLLISIPTCIYVIKQKRYSTLVFCILLLMLYFVCWLAQNVMISGYLIYPFHELDILSFDWKVPLYEAERQRHVIRVVAEAAMRNSLFSGWNFSTKQFWMYRLFYLLSACSLVLSVFYIYIAKNKRNRLSFYFIISIIALAFLVLTAPDVRFWPSFLLAFIFLGFAVAIDKEVIYRLPGKLAVVLLTGMVFLYSSHHLSYYFREVKDKTGMGSAIYSCLEKPYTLKEQQKAQIEFGKVHLGLDYKYIPHKLNEDVTIYVSTYPYGFFWDEIPCIAQPDITAELSMSRGAYEIEARGNSIADGFRTKKKYLDKRYIPSS